MRQKKYNLEDLDTWLFRIRAGTIINLTGTSLAMRDQAHKKIIQLLNEDKSIPISLHNSIIYYVGPTQPDKKGRVLAAGPTTSARMENFLPSFLNKGQKILIGKGELSKSSFTLLKKYGAVYLVPVGGAGAYLASKIENMTPVAFRELGPEAVFQVVFNDFPVIVAFDTMGRNAFEIKI